MRALYVLQQHVALCGVECKTLLALAALFVMGLTGSHLRAEALPYDEAFYVAEDARLEVPTGGHLVLASAEADVVPAEPDSAEAASRGSEAAETAPVVQEDAAPERSSAAPRMNLNTASARLLTQLPGIGPKKAEAVVAYRAEHGAFATVEDLQRVRGIGPKTVAKLAPMLFVEAPAGAAGVEIAAN